MCIRTFCVAGLAWVACLSPKAQAQGIEPASMRQIKDRALAESLAEREAGRTLDEARVTLGPWYRIGPFRDRPPLINWMDNVASSAACVYDVEKDALAGVGQARLARSYPAPNFPATPGAVRKWTVHRDWIDGYYQELPRGPAPSAGETQYVYRRITAEKPVSVQIDCILRAPESDRRMGAYGMEPWRRTGRYTWWVNGKQVIRWGGKGSRDMPQAASVALRKGENHFLAKFTNNRHAYGFAFSLHGRHPRLRHERGFEGLWRPLEINQTTDLPFHREKPRRPDGFAKRVSWLQSLIASRDRQAAGGGGDKPLTSIWPVLYAAFDSADDRREIALASRACSPKDKALLELRGDALASTLASLVVRHTRKLVGPVPSLREDNDAPGRIITRATRLVRYHDCLHRLMALRAHPEPMAGVEHAARDSRGRIVPAMEDALEKYPTSPAGDRHTARLAAVASRAEQLLEKLATTDDPRVEEVFAAGEALETMWDRTIRELPELLFLERPTYSYDSMMFVRAGTKDATVRVFDPKSARLRTLFRPPCPTHEISLSWDGRTVFIGGGGQVHSIGIDGQRLRRLQSGQSPCEMPDGRVIFFDNGLGRSPCKGNGPRQLLFICDADGKNRKVVSANLTMDLSPSIMNDGRVLFTRWDYGVNKNVFNRHALWVQNPDGTAIDLFFGNTVIDPRSMGRARQVPGRPEVATVFGPHHRHLTGLVGLVWNGSGREAADGLGFRRITRDTASVGDRPPVYAYQDVQPLNEQLFLVSYGGRADRKVGLYLLDRAGNKKCILETAGSTGVHAAQVFGPRPRPGSIPDRSETANYEPKTDLFRQMLSDPDWGQKAVLMLQDVYQGIEPEVRRGRAKYLAVMEQVIQSGGRGGAMGVGTIWYANRVIGLVPIEPDGSAHFEVPALRSLYFHVLDKHGRMLMTQGSDFHAMPGEVRSCVGCHEQRKGIDAPSSLNPVPVAARKGPLRPTMPDWGTRGIIEYETTVQPVFDQYCVRCHSGPRPKARLNLAGDRTTVYNMSYMELTDRMLVHYTPGTGRTHAQPTNDCDEQAPLSRGSLLSKITPYIQDSKHCKKKIPFEKQLRVFLWIDSNVPFYGHCRQKSPTILEEPARKTLAEVHRRRCASCHRPDSPDTRSGLNEAHSQVHVGAFRPGQWGIARSGMRVRHLNLSHPEHSPALQAPLARDAGGWGLCGAKAGKNVFDSPRDTDYQRILAALRRVIRRDEPGVKALLATPAP